MLYGRNTRLNLKCKNLTMWDLAWYDCDLGIHLYFPNVMCGNLRTLLLEIVQHFKENRPKYINLIDVNAFNGLKLLFQGNNPYRINFECSTYEMSEKDMTS